MGTWWMVAGLGLALGVKHALDADHVVAVSAMAAETRSMRRSWVLGLSWGVGHTVALMAIGLALLAFRITMPAALAMAFESGVGVMLVVLGVNVLRTLRRERFHIHAHRHDGGISHLHWHAHAGNRSHRHAHRSFAVGLLHGLAGSAAFTLLILVSVPTFIQGFIFAAVFGVGSIVGMMMVSSVIAVPFVLTKRFDAAHRSIKFAAGCLSIVMGVVLTAELTAFAFR